MHAIRTTGWLLCREERRRRKKVVHENADAPHVTGFVVAASGFSALEHLRRKILRRATEGSRLGFSAHKLGEPEISNFDYWQV